MIRIPKICGWLLAVGGILPGAATLCGQSPALETSWQPYRVAVADPGVVALSQDPWHLATEPARGEGSESPPSIVMVQGLEELSSPPVTFYMEGPDGIVSTEPVFATGDSQGWIWQVLPEGLIYPSYWAGVHESRMSGVVMSGGDQVAYLDVTLGGRMAILRYGTPGASGVEGWEFDIEGAAFPRLNLDENWDVDGTDFRFGMPLTYGRGRVQWKFSYYHLSAHMGDELAIRENRLSERINYSRDTLVLGFSFRPLPAWRWYAEAGWAFYYDEGAQPWEFQFGVDVAEPGPTGLAGTPFVAVNGHLREDVDFGGNLVVQTGWLWRGRGTKNVRVGFHYFNGKSSQYEFFDEFEQQIGGGIWADF
jgi:hypothetical protein